MNVIDVFYALGIEPVRNEENNLRISTRDYGRILKCLYLSCYNTRTDSQDILARLTNSEFNDRLTKLLPQELTVAHKIGTHFDNFQSDCGIIYANSGESNYLLCVIVQAKDPGASEEIARISYRVYSYVKDLSD